MLPGLFDRVVREKKFLRTLPNDEVGAFVRGGLEAERNELSLTPKSVVLAALQAVETELRKRAASKPDDPDFDDLVALRTRKGERVFRALVRTGFPKNSHDWRDYSPYATTRVSHSEAPWATMDEDTHRREALLRLGPLDLSTGEVVVAGHKECFARGKGVWYEAKEEPITLRFVSIFEQQWRVLITALAESQSQQFRWTDW